MKHKLIIKHCILAVICILFSMGRVCLAEELLSANLVLNTNKAGNMYFTGDVTDIKLEYFNNSDSAMSLTADFKAVGRRSGNTWEKAQSFELSSWGSVEASLEIDLEKEIGVYDIYDLTVTLSDGSLTKAFNYEFSYVKKAVRNEKFGVNTHYRHAFYAGHIDNTIPMLVNSGISIVRDDANWAEYEKEKGVYEFPEDFMEVSDKLKDAGIDLLTILCFGNTLYTETTSHFPETDEEISAFTNYAADVVSKLKGKHNYFELWNEPNIEGGFNATGSGGDVYAKLIKSVYPAVKNANEDAYLVGISLSGHPTSHYDYISDAFKNGAADYMDAVSWHPYAEWPPYDTGNQPPESFLFDWFDTFKGLCSAYNMNNIWTTEKGWTTKYDNSELQRAEYLVRSYALEMEQGVDKYFWYELINEPVASSGEEESGWGMLRNISYSTPLAAKPSFLAAAAMNSKLANANFDSKSVSGDFYQYNFIRKDLRAVSLIWHESGEETKEVDFGEPSILKTDMYGNEEILRSETGVYTITATTEPAYYEPLLNGDESFRYDYDVNTGICSIYGQIESRTEGVPVSIILYKPDMSYLEADPVDATNAVSYFNQIITDEDGYFSYTFMPDGPEGIYGFTLSSFDGDERSYDLRLMSGLYAEVSIKDKTIDEINTGDTFTCNVDVTGTNAVTKVYNVYLALYKEDRLVRAYAKCDEVMNNAYQHTTELEIENAPAFDKVKAFVWEKELKPLTNSPEINKKM